MKSKTIYELDLHESLLIEVANCSSNDFSGRGTFYPYVWQVTRVATGWIYQHASPSIRDVEGYFVPLTTYVNPTI